MTSTSGLKLSERTELQMRDELAKKDRAGWFGAGHADGANGIISRLDGREVSRSYRITDRDLILTMARSYDAMREALQTARCQILTLGGDPRADGDAIQFAVLIDIDAALSLANGSKSSTDEVETGELRI